MTDKEIFAYVDKMFSRDTTAFEVKTSEWQAIKRHCGIALDGRPPTQKGWHFWAFEVEEDNGDWVLAMLGPKMQAASFTVPKDSIRAKVVRQFLVDMQPDKATGDQ